MLATLVAQRGGEISFAFDLAGILALAAGILIFVVPKALNYIVAIYLIVIGLITLFNVTI